MEIPFKSYRKESRINYGTSRNTDSLNLEELQTGCLMRIADATEKMASNFTQLQNEVERYKRIQAKHVSEIATLEKRVAAYKGLVKRLKNGKK